MRFVVYIAAVLVAAGTIYFVGRPPEEGPTASSDPVPVGAAAASVTQVSGKRLALEVPDMHCAFGCFPTIKKTLEELEGVASVELAPQKSEDVLDDKTVFVTTVSGFQLDEALASLEEAGFEAKENSERVAQETLAP